MESYTVYRVNPVALTNSHSLLSPAAPPAANPSLHPSTGQLLLLILLSELKYNPLWEAVPPPRSYHDLVLSIAYLTIHYPVILLTALLDCKLLEGRIQVLFLFVPRISSIEPDIMGTHEIFIKLGTE